MRRKPLDRTDNRSKQTVGDKKTLLLIQACVMTHS